VQTLPAAVIFDCDGTLVDSEPLSGEAWRRTLLPYGYEVTHADLEQCVGIPYTKTHTFLAQRVRIPDAPTLWPQLRTHLFALLDSELQPFNDAVNTLSQLRERGVPVAVASSSVRERLNHTLAGAGLHFEVSIAGDEVEHGKPAPDMFLLAAARLGVAPEACVVIEDSPPGVAAGIAAGMPTLGVQRDPDIDLSAATRVVNEVSARAILALANQ
jgi:HAD superfamily hydrolase (TIGR01509 family)